ncbi:hypothetical protein TNCV_2543671 [Trichonephila clavipes]|nr:hypothetical protein TNCV_2543671 [Trichonephila clavipes]
MTIYIQRDKTSSAKHNRGRKEKLSETGRREGSLEENRDILADQVHPMMQTLYPAGDGIFRDDNAPTFAAGLI